MSPSGASRTVLVVEDEPILRAAIAQELGDAGWKVVQVSTAEGAIAHLQSGAPVDVVFTDIQLAGRLSGWELAEWCRAARADCPIIYASGNAIDRSRSVPGSLFFDKPYQGQHVVEACLRFTTG